MHDTYTITRIDSENCRTKTLVLDRSLTAQPGQFVMVWLPGLDEKPFSVANNDPLSITVVAVGPFSEALHSLRAGDRVWIRGPLGQGFALPEPALGNRLLLVGGGYGAAPLLFLAQEGVAAGCRVDVCLGAKTAADVILTSAFTDIGSCVRVTTEDGSLGTRGLVTQAVVAAIRDDPPDAVYGCGPVGMLAAVERQCATYGLPYQLSWEARMRCGMGLCGACEVHGRSIDGWLVCRDGPVDRG